MNCGNYIMRKLSGTSRQGSRAFTLIELLLVITIIGLLAGLGLPHLKGWGEANTMSAATSQLMNDLSLARQRAISSRSTVYVVFVSPAVVDSASFSALSATEKTKRSKLFSGQYTSYALYTDRPVGEQPGHINPKYLTAWKTLPEKTFIATNKFIVVNDAARFSNSYEPTNRPFATKAFPFPTVDSPQLFLPYVEFNSQGQLVSEENPPNSLKYFDAFIPVTKGSIFYERDRDGNLILGPADAVETPLQNSVSNYNNIHIDWLTGRARLERREIQ